VQVVHEPADGREATTIATSVDCADTVLTRMRGLMFRRSIPDDYALAFRFDDVGTHDIHMLFVRFPLDVLWVTDGVINRVETLDPWRGFAKAEADLILELPAGNAAGIEPGDRIRLEKHGRE